MSEKNRFRLLSLHGAEPLPEEAYDGLLLVEAVRHVLPHGPLLRLAARVRPVNLAEASHSTSEAFQDFRVGLVDPRLRRSVQGAITPPAEAEMETAFSVEEAGGPGELFSVHVIESRSGD